MIAQRLFLRLLLAVTLLVQGAAAHAHADFAGQQRCAEIVAGKGDGHAPAAPATHLAACLQCCIAIADRTPAAPQMVTRLAPIWARIEALASPSAWARVAAPNPPARGPPSLA